MNLIEKTIELFTVGAALFDRRVHEAKGLVLWLINGEDGLHDEVLHLRLEKPILRWSAADTEGVEFTDRTYAVLKQWLKLERWNRRYFPRGVARGDPVGDERDAHGRQCRPHLVPLRSDERLWRTLNR